MNVLILAAGFATRLHPLTRECPKALLDVAGRPAIDWLLDRVAGLATHVFVVVNERFHASFEAFGQRSSQPFEIHIVSNGVQQVAEARGAVEDLRFGVQHLVSRTLEAET